MEPEDRRLLYQNAFDETRYLKNNQWRFSHYGLLIQGALVTIHRLTSKFPFSDSPMKEAFWRNSITTFLLAAAALIVLALIHEAQQQIIKRRLATRSLRDLTEWKNKTIAGWHSTWSNRNQPWPGFWDFPDIWTYDRWKGDWYFGALFASVQAIAWILAVFLIWAK